MTIFGPDISSYQGYPAFGAVAGGGNDFVIIKATEATGYVNPAFAATRSAAHAAGMAVGLYHFAKAGNAQAEADFFLRTVGRLQPGEFPVLDWEVPAGDPPGWCLAWLNAVHTATGQAPLVYMNQSACAGSNWSAVAAAGYRLWLAKYDGDPFTQPAVPWWGTAAMKQYTDSAAIPGIAGPCDRSAFYGTRAQLAAGAAPTPVPSHPEDDMPQFIQSPARGFALVSPGFFHAVANDEERAVAQAHYGNFQQISDREFDVLKALAMNTDFSPQASGQIAGAVAQKVPAGGSATVDPVALAAALLANADAVNKLGDAIAAGLATRVHNG